MCILPDDPLLRLMTGSVRPSIASPGTIAVNDDFVSSCPMLEYDFSGITECGVYTVVQGCYSGTSCSGQTAITFLPSYTR